MPIKYADLGADRQLNQIVMAGSHDAGINSGLWHVKTQSLNIGEQAAAGVRVFDLRIAAENTATFGGGDNVKLKAYHGVGKKTEQVRTVKDLGTFGNVKEMKMRIPGLSGSFGDGLSKMLEQAKVFVTSNPSEFLILKFDKCTNWLAIARTCVRALGNSIYDGGGNLNITKIGKLAGKVVVVFTPDGFDQVVKEGYGPRMGILAVRRVDAGHPYEPGFQGLQYCGKGGTKLKNVFGDKIKENIATQSGYMKEGAAGDPNVMGMMYWTTTGLVQSIHSRNVGMWTSSKQSKLRALWESGLSESIQSRLGGNIDPTSYSSGGLLKAFMPNIVMIDFAKEKRCEVIYELNAVAATQLTAAAKLVSQHANLSATATSTGRGVRGRR